MSAVARSADEPDPDGTLRALAAALGLDYRPVLPEPSSAALALLPRSLAVRFSVAPVMVERDEFTAEDELYVAISDPLSFDLIDNVRFSLRRDVRFVVAAPAEIQRIIARSYPRGV